MIIIFYFCHILQIEPHKLYQRNRHSYFIFLFCCLGSNNPVSFHSNPVQLQLITAQDLDDVLWLEVVCFCVEVLGHKYLGLAPQPSKIKEFSVEDIEGCSLLCHITVVDFGLPVSPPNICSVPLLSRLFVFSGSASFFEAPLSFYCGLSLFFFIIETSPCLLP